MIVTPTPFGIQVTFIGFKMVEMVQIDSKVRILLLHESILKQSSSNVACY